jgi:DNA-binding GntR family transcriptional regulator
MEAALITDDRRAWADADADFHRSLANLCGNRRLDVAIRSLFDQTHRARLFTLMLRPKPEESTLEHRQILDAVLAGDVQAAGKIYREHRERSQKTILSIIEKHNFRGL